MSVRRMLVGFGAGLQLLVGFFGLLMVIIEFRMAVEMLMTVVLLVLLPVFSIAALGRWRSANVARVTSIVLNGLVLAMVGLATIGALAERAGSGEDREVVALLVGMVVMGTSSLACFVGLLGYRAQPAPEGARAVTLKRVMVVGASGLGALVVGLSIAVAVSYAFLGEEEAKTMHPPMSPRPAHMVYDEDLNYSFGRAADVWSVAPRDQWGPAKLMLTREDPAMIFMLMAEALAPGQVTVESYAEFSLNNLRRRGTVTVRSSEAHDADGLEGRRLVSDARIERVDYRYVHWVHVHNGFAYQLVLRGPRAEAEQVEAEAAGLLELFRVIDLEKSTADLEVAIEPFASERWGYRVDLTGLGWNEAADTSLPAAEYEAVRGASRVIVIPVSLMGVEPRGDALTRALLHAMQIEFPGPTVTGVRAIRGEGVNGRAITVVRQIQSQTYEYRLHAVRGREMAYLVAAWQLRGGAGFETLDAALAAVEIDAEAKAPGVEEMTESERDWQGTFINQLGLNEFNRKQYRRATELFRMAAEIDPEEPVYVQNVIEGLYGMGQAGEALAYLQSQAGRHPDHPVLLRLEARLRAGLGEAHGAIEAYEQLVATGYQEIDDVTGLISLLTAAEMLERAGEVLEEYVEPESSLYRTLLAGILAAGGEHEEAIGVLRQELEFYPGSEAAAEALFDIYYYELDRYHEAIEVCNHVLGRGPDADFYYWRALAELELDWYPQAQESLRLAVRHDPTNEAAQRLLNHVTTQLGQGDTSAIREALEPVAVPAELLEHDGEGVVDSGSGAIYDYRVRAVEFEPGQRLRTTHYQRARMHDRRGIDQFSTLRFGFDPASERIFVNSVAVFDRNGERVWEGTVSNYYVMDEGSGEAASQNKVLHIPIGSLAPGRAVEVVVTRLERQTSEHMPFQDFTFVNALGVQREVVYVRADRAHVAYSADPRVEVRTVPDGMVFMREGQAAFRTEPRQPPLREFVPSVRIGPKTRDWADVAKGYLSTIGERLEVTERVRSLAEELVAEAKSDQERIEALVKHVQGELTYRAIAFGPRAYVPAPVDEVIRNGSGDCKDHALLLHLLLRAAGIESHLALVHTGGDIDPDLPSLLQFNHKIVMVPGSGEPWFIDATDKETNAALLVPYGLAEYSTLVLDPEDPRLVRIPAYPDDSSRVTIDRRISVERSGELLVHERLEVDGYTVGWLRALLAYSDASEYAQVMQAEYGVRSSVQVIRIQAENIFEPSLPLVVHLEYRVADSLRPIGGRLTGTLPAPFEWLYLSPEPVADRESPFRLSSPLLLKSRVRIALPEGMTMVEAPREGSGAGMFWSASRTIDGEAGSMLLEIEARSPAGLHPPEAYAAYCDSSAAALRLFEATVVLEPGGGR